MNIQIGTKDFKSALQCDYNRKNYLSGVCWRCSAQFVNNLNTLVARSNEVVNEDRNKRVVLIECANIGAGQERVLL